jgi:hypothetical protein
MLQAYPAFGQLIAPLSEEFSRNWPRPSRPGPSSRSAEKHEVNSSFINRFLPFQPECRTRIM